MTPTDGSAHPVFISPSADLAAVPEQTPLNRPLQLLLWTVAAGVLAGWLALVALHFDDDYRVGHLQGIWMAAAEGARSSGLYPPLFDGEHYAGTRWMPLAILSNATAAAIAGDALSGGKVLAAVLMAILLGVCVLILKHVRCPLPLASTLAASIVATDVGLQAGTTIGGDLLSTLLQVAAIGVALQSQSGRAIMIAGVLAGLAAASKLTGFWGLLALATCLLARGQRRAAASLVTAAIVSATLILVSVQVITGGGLLEHLVTFSLAGVGGSSSLSRAPNQLLFNLRGFAVGTVVLLPLAVLGAVVAKRWKEIFIVHVALGYALVLTMLVYADNGTGSNQLLDVVVLTALAAGHLAGRPSGDAVEKRQHLVIATAVALSALWATGLDLVRTVGFDLRRSMAAVRSGEVGGRVASRVASSVKPGEKVFAEDPAIDVALGRRPVVMDPYLLTRLDRVHPEWIDPLIARIENRQFDLVVLIVSLDDRSLDYWWTDYHFGPRIAKALRASYRFERSLGRYYLYRPSPVVSARPAALARPWTNPSVSPRGIHQARRW